MLRLGMLRLVWVVQVLVVFPDRLNVGRALHVLPRATTI